METEKKPLCDPDECKHEEVTPAFDAAAARGCDPYIVRDRWPRFEGKCPSCGEQLIMYASYEHYIRGDW